MKESLALDALAALAHETRLKIVRLLVKSGKDGMAAGNIAAQVGASSSRLSFHISALEHAGLVSSERQSRHIIYRAKFDQLGQVISYLMNDCCGAHPVVCACCAPKKT